jgi:hypothetical protein
MLTTVETPAGRCRWGLARADITPPVGIYHRMWGAATHDRATGVHRPLLAMAVAMAPSDEARAERFVLVALDHCLLWPAEMAELRAAVLEAHALSPERLLITFSHTHASGLMDRSRSDLPGGELITPYFAQLVAQVVDIVGQAQRALTPVTITYGSGRCNLAGHRDAWDEESRQWVCGWNPAGSSDDTVLLARVTDDHARTVASLVNYACHPTTLAWENTLISPDYIGALRETVEQATGAPCLFLQGASGDLGPRDGYVGDTAVADRNGRQLAYAALSTLTALPPPQTTRHYAGPVLSGATLGTWADRNWSRERRDLAGVFELQRVLVPLPYRADRPPLADLRSERTDWLAKEQTAIATGDASAVRAARTMVERLTRALTKWSHCPPGDTFPYELTLLRLGDAVWVFGEGELYQLFQTELRRRCPDRPVCVVSLANGWRCSYLPTRETYGRGVYQEEVAILAPGCLERVIDAAVEAIQAL